MHPSVPAILFLPTGIADALLPVVNGMNPCGLICGFRLIMISWWCKHGAANEKLPAGQASKLTAPSFDIMVCLQR